MTGSKKRLEIKTILSTISEESFHVEIKKSLRGAVAVISGVMGIGEYTEDSILLLSHSGRMTVVGESLGISVLEERTVEIYGRITEVRLGYGKS